MLASDLNATTLQVHVSIVMTVLVTQAIGVGATEPLLHTQIRRGQQKQIPLEKKEK